MNNFNRNPFGNSNSGMNQTRIVSKYNQVSKDGGRVSTEEVKKNMQQLKGNDVRITVFPNQQSNQTSHTQSTINNQQNTNPSQSLNSPPQRFNNSNGVDQMKMARDRMNNFRNMGRN